MENMYFLDKFKKAFWTFVYHFFTKIQKIFLHYKIKSKKNFRMYHHIGWLNPINTLDELKVHLHTNWGFGNHFISILEEDEVLSWRKIEPNKKQYHIKVFKDGEIRGAFEFRPEENFFGYFKQKNREDMKEDFFDFLKDFVVKRKKLSDIQEEEGAFSPEAEEFFVQKDSVSNEQK